MKKLLGGLLIVAGIIFAIYVGVIEMFIGGIIDMINAAKADDISAWALLWGYIKMALSGGVIIIMGAASMFLGLWIWNK